MVEPLPSKQDTRVRFPPPALSHASHNSRLRSASALISAPSSNAIPLIHSHVSITITAESAPPHVLLYDANVAV